MQFLKAIQLSLLMTLFGLAGCASDEMPSALEGQSAVSVSTPDYVIGPGDNLSIFVWRNPEVTTSVPVRPDGRISTPLVEDQQASGLTPTQLARQVEESLSEYIREPKVTVIVTSFAGTSDALVKVLGEAATPAALKYRDGMTLLDLVIGVGGLTEFADGNRANLIRVENGEQKIHRVRLDDLLRDGDITANVPILPGDVLIIPENWF